MVAKLLNNAATFDPAVDFVLIRVHEFFFDRRLVDNGMAEDMLLPFIALVEFEGGMASGVMVPLTP